MRAVVGDLVNVLRRIRAEHPELPVGIIGHSWGSLVTQMLLSTRPELVDAPPVARIGLDWKQVSDRLGRSVDRIGDQAVLVLELAGGDVVAVLDDWDITARSGARDGESTLVALGPGPADRLAGALVAATGLTAGEVTTLSP